MFGLLLSPVFGVVRLAELIQREADREFNDPAALTRALEAVAEARANGELTETEARRAESELLERLYPPRPASAMLPDPKGR